LFARMGGEPKLHDFVYGFYDRMLADKEIAPLLLKSQGAQAQAVYMKLIKDRTIEYLEQVWGGDEWEGQDMFRLHAMLHINDPVYDRSIKCAAAQVKHMRLSKDVVKDIMQEMETMREPITDPGGKLHKWIQDKQTAMESKGEEEGQIKGAMGFTISAAQMKQMSDEAKRREDMKVRLAAEREKRQAREKAERKAAKAKEEAAKAKAEGSTTPKAEETMTPKKQISAKSAQTPTAKLAQTPTPAKSVQSAVQSKENNKAVTDSNGKTAEGKIAAKDNATTKKKKSGSEPPESPCTTAASTTEVHSSFEKAEDDQVALSKASEKSKEDQEVFVPPLPVEGGFACLQDSVPMPMPGGVSKLLSL